MFFKFFCLFTFSTSTLGASSFAQAAQSTFLTVPAWKAVPDGEVGSQTQLAVSRECSKPEAQWVMNAKVAFTVQDQAKGLSQRKNPLGLQEAMLFWFSPPKPQATFWMKDTYIPLSLIYFDEEGKQIAQFSLEVEKDPAHPQKIYASPRIGRPVAFALELSQTGSSLPADFRLCLPAPHRVH